jgi:hypothetical protein
MSTTLFKRTAATFAAFIAMCSAGALSLPVAGAATTSPAISHRTHTAASGCRAFLNGRALVCPPTNGNRKAIQ